MHLIRSRALWLFLLVVGLLRLVSLAQYPLMDTTEARYGEIARIIAETGNWVVPQIDYGVPFWGKPPLSFWASALSIEGFANSEFFLRLPHFVAALVVLGMIWPLALAQGFSRRQAQIAIAVVATTIGFLLTAGAVMTDMFLCLAMTLTMVGFWRGWHGERRHVYLMYAGLGIGLLAKGPIILVLAGLVILPWIAATQGFRALWIDTFRRLQVVSGLLLMLAIALPWYFLMEKASPGFLEYFLVGEHFQRFLDSGWHGDLYGSGHARMRGTIWLYWFLFAFPWSLLLLVALVRSLAGNGPRSVRDPKILFLLLWMGSPMLLFTLAGNILPAYILPGLPAVGVLVVGTFEPALLYRGRLLLLVGPALLVVLSIYLAMNADDYFSDRRLLSGEVNSGHDLFYFHERPFSGQYYSNGHARVTDEFPTPAQFYLVIENDRQLDAVDQYCALRAHNAERRLYFCRRDDPA